MPDKVIGILGGMGPEATIRLFETIVKLTPAGRDQDHLQIIVNNNPRIPDRTESILNADRSIVSDLVDAAVVLERAGAEFIAMPCNTAHYYFADLVKLVKLPVINMIDEVAEKVRQTLSGSPRVGVLSTTGTYVSRVYQDVFQAHGIAVIETPEVIQTDVMKAVMKIKSIDQEEKNQARELLLHAGNLLVEQGAEGLVLGCTEIPLVIDEDDFEVPVFDSLQILAEKTLDYARGPLPD
jgi:aspartate racemase